MEGIPDHIGIIPDGNRRFAKKLLEKPWKGHEWGTDRIKRVFEWCKESGIKIMTFYALSLENLTSRPQEELGFLFALAKRELKDILNDKGNFVHENNVRMRFFGRIDLLPGSVQELIKKVHRSTKDYKNYHMNVAMAYGGRQEIVRAVNKLVRDGTGEIDERMISEALDTAEMPDPDLLVRTSGEYRVSNFLLWQIAYAELYITETLWPEFDEAELDKAIESYSNRERRFGMTDEQLG